MLVQHPARVEKALGPAARQDCPRIEASVLLDGCDATGLLLRTAEPVDWSRSTLGVSRASGSEPGLAPMLDAAQATAQ